MPAATLQLVSYGAQDMYLTGNPQITYFKVVYRRHTNFSMEDIVIDTIHKNTIGYDNTHTILLPKNINKEEVINFLKNLGIQTSMHYPSFHNFSFYKKFFSKNKSPVSSEFIQRELTLPLYPDLKFKEVDYVCDSIKKYFDDKNF